MAKLCPHRRDQATRLVMVCLPSARMMLFRWIGSLTLVLLGACAAPPAFDLYEVLEECAQDPELRPTVSTILANDLHPDGRSIATTYAEDPDDGVRANCLLWWIRTPSEHQNAWLAKALADPSPTIQAYAVLHARHIEPWDAEVHELLWNALETTQRAHVFEAAAQALAERGGEGVAHQVYWVAHSRGAGWLPYTLPAIVQFPHEDFRAVFEAGLASDRSAHACLGQRGLNALDGEPPSETDCQTTQEFHEQWRSASYALATPSVLTWAELTSVLREHRVIILGELHAAMPARASQIAILAELCHADLREVVLVLERPVLTYQEPLRSAAAQYAIDTRFLESEELASQAPPSTRDRVARTALAQMVQQETDKTFLVVYGENHRASLQAAVQQAGVECISITTSAAPGMLGSSMRAAHGRIQGFGFEFPNGVYYVPRGSYATILGSPALDRVFLK